MPHIDTMKPSSELWFKCQQHATEVFHSANENEEKAQKFKSYRQHIQSARMQREHYNDQCKEKGLAWEKYSV